MGNGKSDAIPRKRTKDLVVRAHGEETLVLDRRTGNVHCLPAEVTRVWRACTGSNTLAEIASAAGVSEQIAASAVDQLLLLDLLEHRASFDRRKFLRRSAMAGGGALMIPVIESVVLPPAAMAQSRPGTLDFSAVCGVGGVSGQMGWIVSFRANTGWDANTQYLITVAVANGGPTSMAGLMTAGGGAGSTDPNGTAIGNAGRFPNPGTPVTVTVTNTRTQQTFTFEKELTTAAGDGCPVRGQFAYVANNATGANRVSVVNTATNTLTTNVTVGARPYGVAVTPDSSRVYVTNGNSNTVSVINTATNAVVATIGVGSTPVAVAISPDGSRAYVANFISNGTVSVINTASNTVTATLGGGTPALFSAPFALAVSPDGTFVYVTNTGGTSLSRINTATNAVTAPAVTGLSAPAGVAFSPDGSRAYVTNRSANNVRVIDTANNTLIGAAIPVGTNPEGIVVTSGGSRVYNTNLSNSVSVINTANNAVTTLTGFSAPEYLAATPDGSRVYVSNTGGSTLSMITVATNAVTAPAVTGFSTPAGIAIGTPITA